MLEMVTRMNYMASISDFFKSPKWLMNLLLGGVCCLIPIVGPLVLMGWLITGFWAREDQRPETFPDFDFNQFGKYLERGGLAFPGDAGGHFWHGLCHVVLDRAHYARARHAPRRE